MHRLTVFIAITKILLTHAFDFEYLDPTKLQTRSSAAVQQDAALKIIQKYLNNVTVEVNPSMFSDKKDVFELATDAQILHIRASTGVAAVWGFHYYLKQYCKSHIGWQVKRIAIPSPLPEINIRIVANDRFRYYQNVCTFSYSFVWWNVTQWIEHVEWMAMNGINLPLAPVDQEAAWAKVYKSLGMTDEEIDKHFTGPAFLSWLRMGNIHGWAGPLLKSWHDRQSKVQNAAVNLMYRLGMVPVLPSFNGHVPKAFHRIYPNQTFETVDDWMYFGGDYCCALFLSPTDSLFATVGEKFLSEITNEVVPSHVYNADSFNEIGVSDMTVEMIRNTAKAIFAPMVQVDKDAVWLIQNWMFVNSPCTWTKEKAQALLLAVPKGRILVLDLIAEHYPQYNNYDMYYGQPFIWCMLHDFGGTLGMIGKMSTINKDVYEARSRANSTMIGIGLTPEGINQNYVVYDLMLEAGWRKRPVRNLNHWVTAYAERRYGCKSANTAWKFLLKSVYNYNETAPYGYNTYLMTQTPSFHRYPKAWYESKYLFKALESFASASTKCNGRPFYHDLVDVTRQALQYRAEQIYFYRVLDKSANISTYKDSMHQFLNVLQGMEVILASNDDFTIASWLDGARGVAANPEEIPKYELNARNQITLWGPNGEISDYANKQWAEMFHYYYIPRWTSFLKAALVARIKNIPFDAQAARHHIRETIEKKFVSVKIERLPKKNPRKLATLLYRKWGNMEGLPDLPQN